jgi:hypothetical protein
LGINADSTETENVTSDLLTFPKSLNYSRTMKTKESFSLRVVEKGFYIRMDIELPIVDSNPETRMIETTQTQLIDNELPIVDTGLKTRIKRSNPDTVL